MGLNLKLQVFHLLQVVLIEVRHTLEFVGSAKDCELQATDFLVTLLLELSQFNK
jgi:hypothetical protein